MSSARTNPPSEPIIENLSLLALAYCCVVMVLAYAARGASGFGAAAAMPLLGLVIPLKVLIPAWTLIGLAAGIALYGSDRRHIAWGEITRLLPGCLVGIAVGLYVFKRLDSATLARGLGVIVVVYGCYSLWGTFSRSPKWAAPAGISAAVGGALGGLVGTLFGTMASLFFAIYFDAIRMGKEHFRGSMTAILLALGFVRGIGYWAVGEFNRDVMIVVGMALPMMLIGILIGNRIYAGISDMVFRRTVSGALIVSGLALLVK